MNGPPFKMLAVGAVCAFMIIGCEPQKSTPDGPPAEAPAPPADAVSSITLDEQASADQIVFSSTRGEEPSELYRMNRNGSGLTRLTNDLDSEKTPGWTADGSNIVYSCPANTCISDATGRNEEVVYARDTAKLDSGTLDPALSPNGRVLAFSASAPKSLGWDIYLYDRDSKVLTNLTQTPSMSEFSPVWHPLGGLAWSSDGEILFNSGGSDETLQLTDATTESEFAPDFSSDGSLMVFQARTAGSIGQTDIFLTDLDADTTTKLTQTETIGDFAPAFSPDDTQIVYHRKDQPTDVDNEIYVMNVDGTGVTRLTFNDVDDTDPDWGTPVVTVSIGADVTLPEGTPPAATTPFTFDVTLSQAATSSVTVAYAVTAVSASIPSDLAATSGTLTFTAGQKTKTVTVPVVADDVVETAESFKVTLSNPQGAVLGDLEARGVIEDDDFVEEPSPSPSPSPSTPVSTDEGQIAWGSDENGDYDIWVKSFDGSNIRHVTSSVDPELSPDFSPDGEMIVFQGGPGAPDIYWVPSDGSAAPTKIQGVASSADVTPTWSPSGTQVAWVSSGGSVNIVVATPPNGAPSLLYDTPGDEAYLDWQIMHDGHEGVAFQEQSGADDFTIKIFDRTSGALIDLGEGRHPKISPDGTKVVFSSDRDGDLDIYVLDLTDLGAPAVQLTNDPETDATPAWSPDGSQIAFTTLRDGNAEIYTMDADGSNETNFTNRPADDFEPTWGVDPSATMAAPAPDPDPTAPSSPSPSSPAPTPTTLALALPIVLGALVRARRRP